MPDEAIKTDGQSTVRQNVQRLAALASVPGTNPCRRKPNKNAVCLNVTDAPRGEKELFDN